MAIVTSYAMTDGLVTGVVWSFGDPDDDTRCEAVLDPDNQERYVYTSYLEGDTTSVMSPRSMSLADCVLAAHVHLGLIPPRNFEPIACTNQH